jgi:hypothetical protein
VSQKFLSHHTTSQPHTHLSTARTTVFRARFILRRGTSIQAFCLVQDPLCQHATVTTAIAIQTIHQLNYARSHEQPLQLIRTKLYLTKSSRNAFLARNGSHEYVCACDFFSSSTTESFYSRSGMGCFHCTVRGSCPFRSSEFVSFHPVVYEGTRCCCCLYGARVCARGRASRTLSFIMLQNREMAFQNLPFCAM